VQPTRCRDEVPPLRTVMGHQVACHWAEDIKAGKIQPKEVEVLFDPGLQPPVWEPPPS
jgi:peptide/nickel transport system ATP-binding protein